MTTEQKGVDGGPAFPSPSFAVPRSLDAEHVVKLRDMQGMTLRDYFAAKALQGYLSNPTSFGPHVPPEASSDPKMVAEISSVFAYLIADAMLAARGQP